MSCLCNTKLTLEELRGQLTQHHPLLRKNGDNPLKRIWKNKADHEAWHSLFGHREPRRIIDMVEVYARRWRKPTQGRVYEWELLFGNASPEMCADIITREWLPNKKTMTLLALDTIDLKQQWRHWKKTALLYTPHDGLCTPFLCGDYQQLFVKQIGMNMFYSVVDKDS